MERFGLFALLAILIDDSQIYANINCKNRKFLEVKMEMIGWHIWN